MPRQPDQAQLRLVAAPDPGRDTRRQVRLDVVLTSLHVRVPRSERAHAEPLWNHIRETELDTATVWRLRQNGVRAGVGRGDWWDAVRATIDALPGVTSVAPEPVRLPAGYPLALELDDGPRERTVFVVGDDGIPTGETWPAGRNVLRVTYELNLDHPDRVRVAVVPEIRQHEEGWRWIRSEVGLTKEPNYNGRALAAAALVADLQPGEFLVVAPADNADVYGLVGNVFLSGQEDGRRYDSLVFLRVDVNHVAQRN